VLGEVVDALLAEDDVGPALDDLVDLVAKLLLLLVEELLELVGGVDVDGGVDVGLLDLDRVVEEEDVGRLERRRHVVVDGVLVDDGAGEELGLAGRASRVGLDVQVREVDDVRAVVRLDGDALHRAHDEVGEGLLVEFGALAGHRRLGDVLQRLRVVGVDPRGDLVDLFAGVLAREVEALDDRCRVDVLFEEVLGVLEELARDRDRARRAVAGLVLLRLGDLDDHLGGRVVDVHRLQDGDAVVRDGDVAHRVDEHLVHPFRPERRTYGLGDAARRGDVVLLCVTVLDALGVVAHDDHRLTLLHSLAHTAFD